MKNFTFRAYDKKNKKWLMGYRPDRDDMAFSLTGEAIAFGEWGDVFYDFIFNKDGKQFDDLDIMQWTGMRDVEGRKIFEGDIVAAVNDKTQPFAPVVFNDGCFEVDAPFEHDQEYDEFLLWYKRYQVVGNIYDNPEILK